MRAIWKGAVSFGLVNVPVRLYSATENHDVQFRQVHREDGGRIKYKRTCSIDGEEVSYDDIAKGYETEDGDMVVLTDDDFADLPSTSVQGDRRDEVRPRRPDRPDVARQELLPRARQGRHQALHPAARRAGQGEADGDLHRLHPHPDDDGRAARARRRHRHADDALARRDPRRRLRGRRRRPARHQAGDGHGEDAHRPARRRLRAQRVRGRLRHRGQGARARQGRGWRGARQRRRARGVRRGRRPARSPGPLGREGQGEPRRGPRGRQEQLRRLGHQGSHAEDGGEEAAATKSTAKKAPAKKTAEKKTEKKAS